eukprot:1144923-Pelagomonas_calceolata.AAC.8
MHDAYVQLGGLTRLWTRVSFSAYICRKMYPVPAPGDLQELRLERNKHAIFPKCLSCLAIIQARLQVSKQREMLASTEAELASERTAREAASGELQVRAYKARESRWSLIRGPYHKPGASEMLTNPIMQVAPLTTGG